MRLKTKILLVAVPTVTVVAAGTALAVSLHFRRLRRRRESSFLSSEVRSSLQGLCMLKAEDFVPDGLGTSLYQRRLESLNDRQLIGVYVVLNAAKVLRDRGVDIHSMSKQDVATEIVRLHETLHGQHDRRAIIKRLASFGADTARSMLSDGLVLTGMALQAA